MHATGGQVVFPPAKRSIILAVTGASGALFAQQMLRMLEADERVAHVNFICSVSGMRVAFEELGLGGRSALPRLMLGAEPRKTRVQNNSDVGACVASGSHPTDAMVVLPCSMATLGRIANGVASRLIERAADVCLKERIPLVLCVRETPLNLIHLRNMTQAAEAGATVFPVMPAMYTHPASIEEMARQFVSRVLKHIGLPQADAFVWKPEPQGQ
jgi:4-hydroxy-3-polyprenylbenzoate decarboxylase